MHLVGACRVLQPGNPQLSGAVPLGTPYPVLRYNGPSGYSMCSQFPCTREPFTPVPIRLSWLRLNFLGCIILPSHAVIPPENDVRWPKVMANRFFHDIHACIKKRELMQHIGQALTGSGASLAVIRGATEAVCGACSTGNRAWSVCGTCPRYGPGAFSGSGSAAGSSARPRPYFGACARTRHGTGTCSGCCTDAGGAPGTPT